MNRIFVFSTLILAVCCVGVGCKKSVPTEQTPQAGKERQVVKIVAGEGINLKILYAGHPGSEREKDFVDFLAANFKQVGIADLAKFDGSESEDFDVTILDYDGDGFEAPRPKISREFSRPVVTMGVIGAFICDKQSLKTGYL